MKEMHDGRCCSRSSPRLSNTGTRLYVMDLSFSKKFGTPLVGSTLHESKRVAQDIDGRHIDRLHPAVHCWSITFDEPWSRQSVPEGDENKRN